MEADDDKVNPAEEGQGESVTGSGTKRPLEDVDADQDCTDDAPPEKRSKSEAVESPVTEDAEVADKGDEIPKPSDEDTETDKAKPADTSKDASDSPKEIKADEVCETQEDAKEVEDGGDKDVVEAEEVDNVVADVTNESKESTETLDEPAADEAVATESTKRDETDEPSKEPSKDVSDPKEAEKNEDEVEDEVAVEENKEKVDDKSEQDDDSTKGEKAVEETSETSKDDKNADGDVSTENKSDCVDEGEMMEVQETENAGVDFSVKGDNENCKSGDKPEMNGASETEAKDVVPKQNGHDKVADSASVNSEDSEKENMGVDAPMDLSTTKSSTPGQDVIMLSDEEEGSNKTKGDLEHNLDDLKLKRRMIKRLQADLRNEEAKLVLLKKLRFSQISTHQIAENAPRKTTQPPTGQHHTQPPPLVRGNQGQAQQQMTQAKAVHSSQPPQAQRPSSNVSTSNKPPPLVMAPRMDQRQLIEKQMKMLQQQREAQQQQQREAQQQRNNSSSVQQQQQSNLAGFRGTQSQADALRQLQQAQQAAQQAARVVEETPAQRQAAAKLALRKQLEKTLLQIPPPKPPPPEMNFIPSLASPDFIYLLGLEEAVNFIIDTNLISKGKKSPDEKMVCNPFTCVQCGTDFTPVWKREKPGSKNVICEQCVTSNQKKALKQEHTNRLKSAFVKALQQEQEIERMQSQEIKAAAASASTSAVPQAPAVLKEKTEQRERESSARSAAQAYNRETMAETLRQQHLVQAHQQAAALRMGQPLGIQGFNPRSPYPYQLPFTARAANDLQRQYLLDMIPKGGLPWNT